MNKKRGAKVKRKTATKKRTSELFIEDALLYAMVRVAELAFAKEREECAALCEESPFFTAEQCATAIRMRGEK